MSFGKFLYVTAIYCLIMIPIGIGMDIAMAEHASAAWKFMLGVSLAIGMYLLILSSLRWMK